MASYIGAGKLNKPAQVLELRETSPNVWEWVPVRRAWAQIEFQAKTNLFSSVGIGARDAAMVIRRQSLGLHNAMSWGGHHLFLTSITDHGRGHLDVDAAVVTVDQVSLVDDAGAAQKTFPGVLTEKYARYAQEWPMSVNDLSLVLVVPKVISLPMGHLVMVRGELWEVRIGHELDAYKNEYEIGRESEP